MPPGFGHEGTDEAWATVTSVDTVPAGALVEGVGSAIMTPAIITADAGHLEVFVRCDNPHDESVPVSVPAFSGDIIDYRWAAR